MTKPFTSVRKLLDGLVADGTVLGAGIAVSVRTELVVEHYAGIGTAETLWDLTSIGKVYTAATIVALMETGTLSLSRPVRAWLPEVDGDGRERITLRHLLTHTAGLDDDAPEVQRLMAENAPLDAALDAVIRAPLRFLPGADRRYSGLAYQLAAQIAAVATGVPFPDLTQRLVTAPADLRDTFRPIPLAARGRLAPTEGASTLHLAAAYDGVVATARDLLRFGEHFIPGGPRMLSDAGVWLMTSDQTGRNFYDGADNDTRYAQALGFLLRGRVGLRELAAPNVFGHAGGSGCLLWVDPDTETVGAFVSAAERFLPDEDCYFLLDRVANTTAAALQRERPALKAIAFGKQRG